MVGQEKLTQDMLNLFNANNFPHFSILTGQEHIRKLKLINEIVKQIPNCEYYCLESNKIADVRQLIQEAQTLDYKIVYVFPTIEELSINATNTLLKFTEEPPQNAYIIILATDIQDVLPTIRSRGVEFKMSLYTKKQIQEYANTDNEFFIRLCDTFEDVDNVREMLFSRNEDIQLLEEFVQLTIEHLPTVSLANAFKLTQKLAVNNEEGYPLSLFLKGYLCKIPIDNKDVIDITIRTLEDLKIRSINKQMVIDKWILGVKSCY